MTTWFTSDLHFGHARLLELSPVRGAAFTTVAEMNEGLITNWNSVVAAEDTVWVLGDFDMHGKAASLALLPRLKGTKILVSGNHDACWAGVRDGWKHRSRYLEAGFAAVMDFAVTKLPPLGPEASATRVLLSHFPYVGTRTTRTVTPSSASVTRVFRCCTDTSTRRFGSDVRRRAPGASTSASTTGASARSRPRCWQSTSTA